MKQCGSIVDGYDVAACKTGERWMAAVRVIPEVDGVFLPEFERIQEATFAEGRTEADWARACMEARQRIVLLSEKGGDVEACDLAAARHLDGPSICGGVNPAVAWAERSGDAWRGMLWCDGDARAVLTSACPIVSPAVAVAGGRVLAAYGHPGAADPRVRIVDATGKIVFSAAGRYPVMAGDPDGVALTAWEQPGSQGGGIGGCLLSPEGRVREIFIPSGRASFMNVDATWHAETQRFWLVWVSCPRWGVDERVGLHRDVQVVTVDPLSGAIEPAPGTSNGYVDLDHEAFVSQSTQNMPPILPRLFACSDGVGLAFRRFRFTGKYPHGWDTYVMRPRPGGWDQPGRASVNAGQGDGGFAIVATEDGLVAFNPACEVETFLTFKEEAAGKSFQRRDRRAKKQRVEITLFAPGESLSPPSFPPEKRGFYQIPPSVENPAPDPPELVGPDGRTLIWADLHAHCAYSKCMGSNDGQPRDVLRFQRDVLGCRVLCLTDHVEYMSGAEFAHVMDSVEQEAGSDCIPLYGIEWARYPAHHTNFFAIDRDVFTRLRTLFFAHAHLSDLFAAMRAELPEGSVVAIRHMHGMDNDAFGVTGDRVAETFDPEFEWAMEAMQTRGNMMLQPYGSLPLFPSNFLNAGCPVGIVGGSDHSRGGGVNAFCLTGLWVRDVSAVGVFEALRSRSTFCAANGKLALHTELNGQPMGSRVEVTGAVCLSVRVAAAQQVKRVALLRDGKVLSWQPVHERVAELDLADDPPGKHWYSVTAEGDSAGLKGPVVAHASPFFVTV